MAFLRLSSEIAYQNFTYTCLNSVAWYNSNTHKYDMSIKLLGDNEQEFSSKGKLIKKIDTTKEETFQEFSLLA